MARANRVLKGNKRRAVFDRLIVPNNGYKLPENIRPPKLDLPLHPVGKRVWIDKVILHEVSISYEGKPQRFVTEIPFADIVGEPVSDDVLDRGFDLTTPQGEVITVKWHVTNNRERQGLILHNKSATGTSYYEPNWGQIYGVGLKWYSCDGEMEGTIWANRHIGNTSSSGSGEIMTNTFSLTVEPEYSPTAVRGGLMLGDPTPDKTLWIMGQNLPLRVYPALGEVGRGCIFGFNKNVIGFLTVKPPVPPILAFTGAATARADVVGVNWRKDELHVGHTVVGMQILSDPAYLINRINPDFPSNSQGVMIISSPTTAMNGGANIRHIYFNAGAGLMRARLLLLECDSVGTPQYILNCTEHVWDWSAGGSTGGYYIEPCSGNLPYPVKEIEACGGGGGGNPIIVPPDPEIPGQIGGIDYFCDSSIPSASIDTSYWVGDKGLAPHVQTYIQSSYGITIPAGYWQGRNGWLDLIQRISSGTQFTKSKITPNSFHSFLYKMLDEAKRGVGFEIDSPDWQSFKTWCDQSGLACLTDLQKASLFCTNKLRVPVNFFAPAAGYLSGEILDVLTDTLILLPSHVYDWIDFNDVIVDSGSGITGAFAADIPSTDFKALSSFVNFEPQALLYGISSAKAHRPVDYVKLPGSSWGAITAVDWSSYNLPNMTSSNFSPYVAAEVGVHEIGHSVAYYGMDAYGTILHESPEWLAISGWPSDAWDKEPTDISSHLSKSRSANDTGGMPLTDDNKEAPVSDYGCYHPAEDFAEAYRMYIINPTFLEQKYPQKYTFMVDKVEPMAL